MIKITVDEAFAYDLLSITAIKAGVDRTTMSRVLVLADQIVEQVTFEVHETVIASPEYRDLRAANQRVFDLINLYKTRGELVGDAKAIDMANLDRYRAKQALQTRFFGTELTERKLGYPGVS